MKFVYMLKNATDREFYVGATKDLLNRLRQHLDNNKHNRGKRLMQAIEEHGIGRFEVLLLEAVPDHLAHKAEAEQMEAAVQKYPDWRCLNELRPKLLAPRSCTVSKRPRKYKLTADQVAEIRRLLDDATLTQKQIGEMFGVTQPMVSHIKNGRHPLIADAV